MRRRNLAVLVSLSLMGTMSMTGYAASEKETTTEAASTEAGSTENCWRQNGPSLFRKQQTRLQI